MKSAVSLILLASLVGGSGYALWSSRQASLGLHYELALQKAKGTFLKESVGLRLLPQERYEQEIGLLLSRYFTELQKAESTYPGFVDLERERRFGVSEFRAGRMTEVQKLARDERIDITLSIFEKMRAGQYRPLYTAADAAFRFDVVELTANEKASAERRLRLTYVHWGAFGPVSHKSLIGNIRAVQEEGKPVAIPQLVGGEQPPSLQLDPERWVTQFVPGAEIGYYELPAFPREATAVQLSLDFGIRSVGGYEVVSHIVLPDIPIAESWKGAEGQEWRTQERVATDEELQAAAARK